MYREHCSRPLALGAMHTLLLCGLVSNAYAGLFSYRRVTPSAMVQTGRRWCVFGWTWARCNSEVCPFPSSVDRRRRTHTAQNGPHTSQHVWRRPTTHKAAWDLRDRSLPSLHGTIKPIPGVSMMWQLVTSRNKSIVCKPLGSEQILPALLLLLLLLPLCIYFCLIRGSAQRPLTRQSTLPLSCVLEITTTRHRRDHNPTPIPCWCDSRRCAGEIRLTWRLFVIAYTTNDADEWKLFQFATQVFRSSAILL